jgi:hypothetical protein
MVFPGARPVSRRELLRGTAGAAVALPLLDAMAPARAAEKPPVRLVWVHTESGMWMPNYKPKKTGKDFDLTPTLEPLAPFKGELTVLSGLFHANAFKRNPQAGRHSQDGMCHLTGADLAGTPGVAVRNTVSVDQVAAEAVGERTRLPSLGLTVDRGGTLSYTPSGTPVPAEWDPRAVFNQLFGGNTPEARKRAEERFKRNTSVLDDVLESTRDLSGKLGANDRQKLDEYLATVREVERRARVARAWADKPAVVPPAGAKDPGPPPEKDRTAYVRVLLDTLVLALRTDQTRFATARIGFMGCAYPDIGLPDSYHGYTHHDLKPEKQQAMARIDRHRVGLFAEFLGKLKAVREGDGTLLDACVVHYGAGMGSDHETTDLANLVVGRGGGAFAPAGHVDYKEKPLANLFVRMLAAAGVPVKTFADSTGPLDGV